jgi:hypothetical protein
MSTSSAVVAGNAILATDYNNLRTDVLSTHNHAGTEGNATLKPTTIELGHATDTTLARVSAGLISVEGVTVAMLGLTQTFTAAKTFNSGMLAIRNPADTFTYTFDGGAITANRTLNLPLTTATDTLAAIGMVQTFSAVNTFSATTAFTAASPFSVANGQTLTVTVTAQTVGAATLTIPDFANVSDTFVFTTLAQTLANKTLTTPTIAATGWTNATHAHAAANSGSQLAVWSVVSFTRDLSLASGTQAVTGAGFTPKAVFIIGGQQSASASASNGISDGTTNRAFSTNGNATTTFWTPANDVITIYTSPTNPDRQRAVIASMDADGFTLTWTKNNTPTGTGQFYALCMR